MILTLQRATMPIILGCIALVCSGASLAKTSSLKDARRRFAQVGASAAALVAYDGCKKSKMRGPLCIQAAVYFALDQQTEVVADLIDSLEMGDWNGVAFVDVEPDPKLRFEAKYLRKMISKKGIEDPVIAKVAYLVGIRDLWVASLKGAFATGAEIEPQLWTLFQKACSKLQPEPVFDEMLSSIPPKAGVVVDIHMALEFAPNAPLRFHNCKTQLKQHQAVLPPAGYLSQRTKVQLTTKEGVDVDLEMISSTGIDASPAARWLQFTRQDTSKNVYRYVLDFAPLSSTMPERCRSDPRNASRIFSQVPAESLLVVKMPYWLQDVSANYFGCDLAGAGGEIALPYEGWPGDWVVMRFGQNPVEIRSPRRPGRATLRIADFEWMRGTLRLTFVPPDFELWTYEVGLDATGGKERNEVKLDCTWSDSVGSCPVAPGPFQAEVRAPGRHAQKIKTTIFVGDTQDVEVTMEKSTWVQLDWMDAASGGASAVGAMFVALGAGTVLATQVSLKSLDGDFKPGTMGLVHVTEGLGNVLYYTGLTALSGGAIAEGILLGLDYWQRGHLPEWEVE